MKNQDPLARAEELGKLIKVSYLQHAEGKLTKANIKFITEANGNLDIDIFYYFLYAVTTKGSIAAATWEYMEEYLRDVVHAAESAPHNRGGWIDSFISILEYKRNQAEAFLQGKDLVGLSILTAYDLLFAMAQNLHKKLDPWEFQQREETAPIVEAAPIVEGEDKLTKHLKHKQLISCISALDAWYYERVGMYGVRATNKWMRTTILGMFKRIKGLYEEVRNDRIDYALLQLEMTTTNVFIEKLIENLS